MTIVFHNWEILQEERVRTEIRHCKMCGKNSTFTDTNIRRHNSNGKYIYRFAIYKCENNHTWNKKLDIYKNCRKHERVLGKAIFQKVNVLTELPIPVYMEAGILEVQISINNIRGSQRLDSLLANQIPDWSRTLITTKIREGLILVNEKTVKPSIKLLQHDIIHIFLR
ncbi:S4 domain-containing protein [Psychrobacillus sp. NPDC058041]|uniref:S4 domain-containing protein n=1 Tax=Psychrobacillus sp. NPDC058041 TaxID=3346310 RepID=UPI0036DB067B